MRSLFIASCAVLFGCAVLPSGAAAQKIIVLKPKPIASAHVVRVHKFGHLVRGRARKTSVRVIRPRRLHMHAFALPEQRLFPLYYEATRPWGTGPDMESRLVGGRTVEGGSRYGSHIAPGRTIESGSPFAGSIVAGRTAEGGSRYASRIAPGKTVEGGSPWRGHMNNWRFSGYAAPVRPRGIAYFRAPW